MRNIVLPASGLFLQSVFSSSKTLHYFNPEDHILKEIYHYY